MTHPNSIPVEKRFWAKVDRNGQIVRSELGQCWEWTADVRKENGYGMLWMKDAPGTRRYAHRISWAIHFGPIPDGLYVLHRCDNRLCVRPGHLFLGSHEDNMADMKAKGRAAKGSQRPNSKLTEAAVREIRTRRAAGELLPELAREYGVSYIAAYEAATRRKWKHVI